VIGEQIKQIKPSNCIHSLLDLDNHGKVEELVAVLGGKVDHILIDRMNYHYGDWVYKRYELGSAMNGDFFYRKSRELAPSFEKRGIKCQVLF